MFKRGTTSQINIANTIAQNDYQSDSKRWGKQLNLANQIAHIGQSSWTKSQWDAWGMYNFSNKLDQWYFSKWTKVLKLNLGDETIDFKRSNQIAQKWRSSWPYQGRLYNQLKLANRITRMYKQFLSWERKISYSARTSQSGLSREVEVPKFVREA